MKKKREAPMPDWLAEAKNACAPVLALWPGEDRWHCTWWTSPNDRSTAHWCIEGRWTPGPDPIAFLPMPSVQIAP